MARPISKRLTIFFLATLALRTLHALLSMDWHVEGDVGIPWLMANDWESTLHHRYFWGQNYLGTYDTFVLGKLGHLIFGWSGIIPMGFDAFFGQLFASVGAAFMFAGLLRVKPDLGLKKLEMVAALVFISFLPAGIQKFTFGVGTGYGLTPLAVGLSFWFFTLASPSAMQALLTGAGIGICIAAFRLNIIPAGSLVLALLLRRPFNRRGITLVCFGIALGMLPEVLMGLERGSPYHLAFSSLGILWGRFFGVSSMNGVAAGILPYSTFSPEDAFLYRSWGPTLIFYNPVFRWISLVALGTWMFTLRKKQAPVSVLWMMILSTMALFTFSDAYDDVYSEKRYDLPVFIAIGALVMLSLQNWLTRLFVALRVAGFVVYVFNSTRYVSAHRHVRQELERLNFDFSQDCLSASGGDISATQAINSMRLKSIGLGWTGPTGELRIGGNDSLSLLPEDVNGITARCRTVFHLDTGDSSLRGFFPWYCKLHPVVFQESPAPDFRQPLTIYHCDR